MHLCKALHCHAGGEPAACQHKLFEYALSVFAAFGVLRLHDHDRKHEFQIHYTINNPESNDHDFANRRYGRELLWCCLLFPGSK